jgi:hypothetical protein
MIASRKIIDSLPLLALGTACAAVGFLATTVFKPEAVLDRSVETALARSAASNGPMRVQAQAAAPLASSPNFRLSRHDETATRLPNAVSLGDRIDITGADGRSRTLEVIDVSDVDAVVTQTGQAPSMRFQLVLCREVGHPNGKLVRFIMESETLGTQPAAHPVRTL